MSPILLASASYTSEQIDAYTGNQIIGVATCFIILDITLTTLRYVAWRSTKSEWGWDDYLILPSLLSNLAMYAISIIMVHFAGLGHHNTGTLIEERKKLVIWAKCMYTLEWLYIISTALPKLSVLFMYLRIFRVKLQRIACYFVAGAIYYHVGASLISSGFECQPFAYQWDREIPGGSCPNRLIHHRWVVSFPNIIVDIAILILPVPMLWALQISRARKIALTAVFLIGGLGIASSCFRFSLFFTQNPFGDDGTWTSVPLVFWTIIEAGMYLKAACLPSLRPLFVDLSQKLGFNKKSTTVLPTCNDTNSSSSRTVLNEQKHTIRVIREFSVVRDNSTESKRHSSSSSSITNTFQSDRQL